MGSRIVGEGSAEVPAGHCRSRAHPVGVHYCLGMLDGPADLPGRHVPGHGPAVNEPGQLQAQRGILVAGAGDRPLRERDGGVQVTAPRRVVRQERQHVRLLVQFLSGCAGHRRRDDGWDQLAVGDIQRAQADLGEHDLTALPCPQQVLARCGAVREQQRYPCGGRCQCRLRAVGLRRLRERAADHAPVTVLLSVGTRRQPQVLRRRAAHYPGRLHCDQRADRQIRMIPPARQPLGKPGRSQVIGALSPPQRVHRGCRQDRAVLGQGSQQAPAFPGQR